MGGERPAPRKEPRPRRTGEWGRGLFGFRSQGPDRLGMVGVYVKELGGTLRGRDFGRLLSSQDTDSAARGGHGSTHHPSSGQGPWG